MIADQVDIINMSFSTGNRTFNTACKLMDPTSAFSESLRDALNSEGIVLIGTTANNTNLALASANFCNLEEPGISQYTIAVGGLASSSPSTPWHNLLPHVTAEGGSMRLGGALKLKVANQTTLRNYVGTDLLAPGQRKRLYATGTNSGANAYLSTIYSGSSLAAPAVTGSAALIIQGMRAMGWPVSPQSVYSMLFIGADRSRFSFSTTTGVSETTDSVSGPDNAAGFGRHRTFAAQTAGWPGPWLASRPFKKILNSSGTNTWTRIVNSGNPIPSNRKEYRAVMHWFDEDLEESSDITMIIYNTCPSSGGPVQVDGTYLTTLASVLLCQML